MSNDVILLPDVSFLVSDCEKELEKLKRVKMNSSSDFTISSDWDVIDDEMPKLDLGRKKSEEATSEDLKENMQKGSCVDDIAPEKEVNGTQEDSCVPDITEPEINNHHENSSSSEFDVLDESVEDNQSNLSFSHMEYSISSSLGESSHPSLVPEVEEVEADPEPQTSREYALNVHPYLVAITLSLAFIAILVASAPFGSVQQMKERMSALQTENDELKNLVQSKLENDKLLMALEEQIKSLKNENFKLSESMKALVAQLEEQTAILRKDKETIVQDPYRSEIEKLKEQINILQIDNEELQKQLVRTRYGIYSPHSKEPNANPSVEEKEEPKDKADNQDNRDNSSEILLEEINELRKKLYTEVEKLKSWKDSVQHLVKKLGNGYAGSSAENEKQNFESKESFDHSRSSSEWIKKPKPGKKDRKFSDWSWRDVKKNLRETFEGLQDIDVPNMISSYVDKKKIEGVFDSVSHYFKKAQEKTKKVLTFNNDVNQEMWNFFGQLRNQWNDISNKYHKKYYPTKQTPPKTEDHESQFSKRKLDVKDFETENKFDGYQKQKKPKMKPSNEKYDHTMYPDVESFTTVPTMETPDLEKNEMAPEDKETNEDNSWVFKRAAHRSQLREEEQEAFTNWFLKRGRDFHYNEDESLKEWFKEMYRNGNHEED
ncbi:hypothetical protein AVEN_7112-1 [Araneus ventricosus]|uniref:Uncharacterized protein n=1 Tax=Araneus ventricosus TaxID=182803 RepID=A0A4Y2LVC0_ARAVE|nr:hypothetical protein AVEN_7112-1 [Araneus ventricosus]